MATVSTRYTKNSVAPVVINIALSTMSAFNMYVIDNRRIKLITSCIEGLN